MRKLIRETNMRKKDTKYSYVSYQQGSLSIRVYSYITNADYIYFILVNRSKSPVWACSMIFKILINVIDMSHNYVAEAKNARRPAV